MRMETQTSARITGTQVLPSLASSVHRNVFGGSKMEFGLSIDSFDLDAH